MKSNSKQNPIYSLQKIEQPPEKNEDIADDIIQRLGPASKNSRKYYILLASRIPEDWLYRTVSEILDDPKARNPGHILNYRAKKYASEILNSEHGEVSTALENLADQFRIS